MRELHNRKQIAGWMLCLLVLAGCGVAKIPDTVTEASLIIGSDGRVTSYIVGVLDRDYYDINGLKKMAQEEVAAYNTAKQTGETPLVVLKGVEELAEPAHEGKAGFPGEGAENAGKLMGDGQFVLVSSSYDSAATYQDYTGSLLFYGTVEEAEKAGYQFEKLNQMLYDTKGKKSIVSKELGAANMAKKHVVLLAEGTRVYCPYKVAYISESAEALEDGSIGTADVLPEEYPVIIVLDK